MQDKENEDGRSMIEMLGVLAIIGVLSVGGIAGYSKAMMKIRVNSTVNQISHIAAGIQTLYANQPTRYAGANTLAALVKAQIVSADMLGESEDDSEYESKLQALENLPLSNDGNFASGGFCSSVMGYTQTTMPQLDYDNPDYDAYNQAMLSYNKYNQCGNIVMRDGSAYQNLLRNALTFLRENVSAKMTIAITNSFGGTVTITPGNKIFSLTVDSIPQAACIELVSIDWSITSSGFTGLTVGGQSTTSAMSVDNAVAGCSAEFNTITFVFK